MGALLGADATAVEAFFFLGSAAHCRVVSDTAVYVCPVCMFTATAWDAMEKHRGESGHTQAKCEKCGGHDGEHTVPQCPGGFDAPVWAPEDFLLPRAEFQAPSIKQWPSPRFPGMFFTSVASLTAHTQSHGLAVTSLAGAPAPMPRALSFLPRRHLAGFDKGLAPWTPGQPKRNGRLLYQCPDCRYLFSSWSQWEHHVRVTKHSQPFCCDCGKIVGKFATDTMNHTVQTGHTRVVGRQPSKESHLRLVDANIARYEALIDNPDAQAKSPGDVTRYIHQCPMESCSKVFADEVGFDAHIATTGHGVTRCSVCNTDVGPRDVASHPHAIPDLPADLWPLRDPSESIVVEASEAMLLAYFPDEMSRCPECTLVVFSSELDAHVGSDVCIATRGLRAAGWEHHERYKATKQAQQARDAAPRELPKDANLGAFRSFAQSAVRGGPAGVAAPWAPKARAAPPAGFVPSPAQWQTIHPGPGAPSVQPPLPEYNLANAPNDGITTAQAPQVIYAGGAWPPQGYAVAPPPSGSPPGSQPGSMAAVPQAGM